MKRHFLMVYFLSGMTLVSTVQAYNSLGVAGGVTGMMGGTGCIIATQYIKENRPQFLNQTLYVLGAAAVIGGLIQIKQCLK